MEVTDTQLNRDVWCLLGLPIDATSEEGTLKELCICISETRSCFLSTPNLNFLITSLDDEAFRRSVLDSDWVVADGMPLVWVGRLLGIPLPERVPGSGVFEKLRRSGNEGKPIRVFFFGGPEGVAERACAILSAEATPMQGVGCYYPGFGTVEDMSESSIIDAINATNPDFVLVALGARKGQAWIEHNRARLSAPVISHLGAVVNFVAGTVSRAPGWVQRTGLEWLWRIYQEPSLFKRYWADAVAMLKLLIINVLPLARYLRRSRRLCANAPSPRCQLSDDAGVAVIAVGGCIHNEAMGELRDLAKQACAKGRDVALDLAEVEYIDCAFIGFLQVLESRLRRQRRHLYIRHESPSLRRIFGLARVGYLLEQ